MNVWQKMIFVDFSALIVKPWRQTISKDRKRNNSLIIIWYIAFLYISTLDV